VHDAVAAALPELQDPDLDLASKLEALKVFTEEKAKEQTGTTLTQDAVALLERLARVPR
jgi:hypothetical protein